jgi:hypothetical protein
MHVENETLLVCRKREAKTRGSKEVRETIPSLRRGAGTRYIAKPTVVGSIPTGGESCRSSVVEQWKMLVPFIPAARDGAVVKAGDPSETESGRIDAAR